tara:strand:- start:609 stop:983 length:375 start_codon:yes stop_codon:yes gene_type:complete
MIGKQILRCGVFEGTDVIVIVQGFGAISFYLQKLIIINTDTASVTPIVQIHNKDRIGDEDEYIDIIPQMSIGVNNRIIYDSPVYLGAGQDLEISLSAVPATKQPQYMMVTRYSQTSATPKYGGN